MTVAISSGSQPRDGLDGRERRQAGILLALHAYRTGTVRLVRHDLGGWTHLVATRNGLYAVSRSGFGLVAPGAFYGMTVASGEILLFESCVLPRDLAPFGRIVRLRLDGNQAIVAAEVVATGLNSGCHQIDTVDGRLTILDTYSQCIVQLSPDGRTRTVRYPLGEGQGIASGSDRYAHVNSLLQVGDHILLLCHNGPNAPPRRSEIAVLDRGWQLVGRCDVPARECHNLLIDATGRLLTCDSATGALVDLDGARFAIGDDMTRGLSLGPDGLVVGTSERVRREDRSRSRGAVVFLDGDYRSEVRLDLPGAPCEIRRIDGQDRSLSAVVNATPIRSAQMERIMGSLG